MKKFWNKILAEEIENARIKIREEIKAEVLDANTSMDFINHNFRIVKKEIEELSRGGEVHTFLGYPSNASMVDSIVKRIGSRVYEMLNEDAHKIVQGEIDALGISSERFIDKVVERIKAKQLN